MLNFIKKLHSGTFNYSKYRNRFVGKTVTKADIPSEFLMQLPYLKLITFPTVYLMYGIYLALYFSLIFLYCWIECKITYYRTKHAK